MGRRPLARFALGAALASSSCRTSSKPSCDGDGGIASSPSVAARDLVPAPLRAWPAPLPRPGVAVGSPASSADPLTLVVGDAVRASVPDRCPDHDECVRIANNASDVAQASCDAQCARCCPHESADACVSQACGACTRCADDGCRRAICNDAWAKACRARCAIEASTCAGCRSVWCGDGAARRACRADVEAHHQATLSACERDCAAGERHGDGSCAIRCGSAPKGTCSKGAKDCPLGKSPDCRCECRGAVAGGCVTWDAVCSCG